MRLRVPVDVMILQVISDGQHANPIRVRYLIETKHGDRLRDLFDREEMWSLDYVTQRMGDLRGRDLLERVPPEDSGLYRITVMGHQVLENTIETRDPEFDYVELARKTSDEEEIENTIGPDSVPWRDLVPHADD